ncbi:MAG: GNAT family N-acetyltransferase [Oscillospiraceae bacterium]|nr:GNAT family N-acetyltransferase [Oscillospiraceae bacterium]
MEHKGTVPLETPRLLLRALTPNDAPLVFKNWASDSDVTHYMRWNPHADLAVTQNWIAEIQGNLADPACYEWGIVLKETGEPIGSIGGFPNKEEPERWEVGYALSKKYWRQGIVTEALLRVMDFFKNDVGIHSFICKHAKENPASGAVMRKAGFHYVKDGSYTSFDGKRSYEARVYYLDA